MLTPTEIQEAAQHTSSGVCARTRLDSARDDKLYFAQVHEDPLLEIQALALGPSDRAAVVSSAGCTVLSLLSSGGRIVGIDLNATQNHLVELKHAAVLALAPGDATAMLGGHPLPETVREQWYRSKLRALLSPLARQYWDDQVRLIRAGILHGGQSEKFRAIFSAAIKRFIHPPRRIERLLDCGTIEEQRQFFERHWNTRRWRLWFRLLYNRYAFGMGLDPAFFENVSSKDFSQLFYRTTKQSLADLPIATNYFFHHMFLGYYPYNTQDGLPPYLSDAGAQAARRNAAKLQLVDGAYMDYLRQQPARSIDAFSLSNICEWMSKDEIHALFSEIVRTGTPGARICFRNFVGHTDVPADLSRHVVVDTRLSQKLTLQDRSMTQPRFITAKLSHSGSSQ